MVLSPELRESILNEYSESNHNIAKNTLIEIVCLNYINVVTKNTGKNLIYLRTDILKCLPKKLAKQIKT